MHAEPNFAKIELQLIRVLKMLITERSVSRTAMRLQTTQPAVSAQLRRLRELTGDALLVRSGNSMMPTEAAQRLLEPASRILVDAGQMFGAAALHRGFDPLTSSITFRIAASDYLDPLFLPDLVARLKRLAPGVKVELLPLSGRFDYRQSLANGEIDLVVGNWLEPPAELHLGRLLTDEVVCLVAEDHPLVRLAGSKAWSTRRYLASEHVVPGPLHANSAGVIDEHLSALGLQRNIVTRCAHFGLIPLMVAQSLLVLTTGRQFCSRYVQNLPVRIIRCPVPFPAMSYYQLWHDLTHAAPSARWLREQVSMVARGLAGHRMPGRRAAQLADNDRAASARRP